MVRQVMKQSLKVILSALKNLKICLLFLSLDSLKKTLIEIYFIFESLKSRCF